MVTSATYIGTRTSGREYSLELPDGVRQLGSGTFSGCAISTAYLDAEISVLPSYLFSGCSSLTSVTVASDITEIEYAAFGVCSSLGSVSLPASLRRVDENAFAECGILSDVYYRGTETAWNRIVFDEGNGAVFSALLHCEPSPEEALTVTLDAAGGTVDTETIPAYMNGSYGQLPVPQRDGFTFYGWFTREDGGVRVDADTGVFTAGDHTLYAHWEDTVVASGECSGSLWMLHSSGELVLYGTGTTPSWRAGRIIPGFPIGRTSRRSTLREAILSSVTRASRCSFMCGR